MSASGINTNSGIYAAALAKLANTNAIQRTQGVLQARDYASQLQDQYVAAASGENVVNFNMGFRSYGAMLQNSYNMWATQLNAATQLEAAKYGWDARKKMAEWGYDAQEESDWFHLLGTASGIVATAWLRGLI